jgi:hypothetical protein
MRSLIFILIFAAAAIGQTAATPVKALLYYPNEPKPEVVLLPEEKDIPALKWTWDIDGGCLRYNQGEDRITFCGTFKIIRKKNE